MAHSKDIRGRIKGRSKGLLDAIRRLERAARVKDVPVLITGETGTGKELAARELHRHSGRSGRFVAVNCAAIPDELAESELFGHRRGAFSGAQREHPGLLVEAHGGTLLLDEIGELPLALQPKLLRVIEEGAVRPVGASRTRAVDVRFASATNRDLAAMVASGSFREDLYARLSGWSIRLAPLRERLEDLLPILEARLGPLDGSSTYRMTADFYEALALHPWPFNVRELLALAGRVKIVLPQGGPLDSRLLGQVLCAAPPVGTESSPSTPPRGATARRKRQPAPTPQELERLLQECNGNVSEVAARVGRGRTQVYRWMERHDLDPEKFREEDR